MKRVSAFDIIDRKTNPRVRSPSDYGLETFNVGGDTGSSDDTRFGVEYCLDFYKRHSNKKTNSMFGF